LTVLERVLVELAEAKGPIRSTDLARRVGVSESALEGMIEVLIAKGRLSSSERGPPGPGAAGLQAVGAETVACSGKACGATCVGLEECPFIADTPVAYSLVLRPAATRPAERVQ